MPWLAEGTEFPWNPTTGKRYRGGNVLTLRAGAIEAGYPSNSLLPLAPRQHDRGRCGVGACQQLTEVCVTRHEDAPLASCDFP